jgi:hypothetical protein
MDLLPSIARASYHNFEFATVASLVYFLLVFFLPVRAFIVMMIVRNST